MLNAYVNGGHLAQLLVIEKGENLVHNCPNPDRMLAALMFSKQFGQSQIALCGHCEHQTLAWISDRKEYRQMCETVLGNLLGDLVLQQEQQSLRCGFHNVHVIVQQQFVQRAENDATKVFVGAFECSELQIDDII